MLDWYTDVVAVMTTLVKDLDAAKDAKAITHAFNVAGSIIQSKQIATRRDQLESQFSEFFNSAAKDTTWAAPVEWTKLIQELSTALQKYSNAIVNSAKFLNDPAVAKSMEDFGVALQAIESTTGK